MTFDCNKPQRSSDTLVKFSFVEKFKVSQKISEVSCSQSFVLTVRKTQRFEGKCLRIVMIKVFLVSLYLKFVKFDEEIFKFVSKVSNFTE